MNLPLIIHKDGTIYFYKGMRSETEENKISLRLKQTVIQIQYTDKLEIYKIEDYSIVSLSLMSNNSVNEFINFLREYSYNEIPDVVIHRAEEIEKTIKVVCLTLGKTEIIIKVMNNDLSFLELDKKITKDIKLTKEKNSFIYPRRDNYKLIKHLADKKVNVTFPKVNINKEINLFLKKEVNLRYYQNQAYRALINKKIGLLLMPIGSGKTYVGIKLIGELKKVTLILCENKDNCYRWKNMLLEYLDIANEEISIFDDDPVIFEINKINICSYDLIRTKGNESVFERIYENEYGVIIYDNAHKTVTEKTVDLLYLKSTYKYAFDATLNRSDGEQKTLLYLFGGIAYNVSTSELVTNMYQKILSCYRVDLRNLCISKEEFIEHLSKRYKNENILVAIYKKNDMKKIFDFTKIRYINSDIKEYERSKLISEFNEGIIKRLGIGNLISNYNITNIDIMISAGYRGGTEIEDFFRIGTLLSTTKKLRRVTLSTMYYLINDEKDNKNVIRKEKYLHKWDVEINELDVSKFLGDEYFEPEG